MKQYIDLVQQVFDHGDWQENRTGIRTLSVPGAMMKFDLQEGFPAVTTKKLAFKSAIGELIGFLRGYRSAAEFRSVGCTNTHNVLDRKLAGKTTLGLSMAFSGGSGQRTRWSILRAARRTRKLPTR